MGAVRPFRETDIPQVAELHRLVCETGPCLSPGLRAAYQRYFSRVFLSPEMRCAQISSLVYEEDGVIGGFLGVVPRRMRFGGAPVLAAASSQFVVSPAARTRLGGVQLLRAFLAGPQDLSLADEARDVSRKMWERLGGRTALLHSLRWIRPLQPCQLALQLLRERPRLGPLAAVARPLMRGADALGRRLLRRQLGLRPAALQAGVLLPSHLRAYLPRLSGAVALRPEYEGPSLSWVLERVDDRRDHGALRRLLLRDGRGEPVGWYLYYPGLRRGDVAQVVQIVAADGAIEEVVDHLFQDAWQQGAVAVAGRMEPRFVQALSARRAIFYNGGRRGGRWVLVHARRQELLHAIASGDALLSPLEGELCLRFTEQEGGSVPTTGPPCAP